MLRRNAEADKPISANLTSSRGISAPFLLLAALVLFSVTTPTCQQQKQPLEIPETSFSCNEKVPGYYADPETGCQVYHMCEAGGRKFSYRCPEQTLFQQRMMVCDHWFMVDCKTSPLHYAANLLLGDKNKPFIAVGETVRREFVQDAKAPSALVDRLSFGTKKLSNSRRGIQKNQGQNNNRKNESVILADIQQRTFPATLFSSFTTVPPPLSPETINSEIISAITPKSTVSTLITKINQITTSPPFRTQTTRATPTKSTLSSTRFVTEKPIITKTTQRYRFTTPTPLTLINRFTESVPPIFSSTLPKKVVNVSREINRVLETTQSLPDTTTSQPTTTVNTEFIYPSTINSLLRNTDSNEPALLEIIPDTRRMFFIPHSISFDDNIPSDFEEQRLEFQSRTDHIRSMRFNKDIADFQDLNGGCPARCIPAFFKPGSCEPCVILR